MSCISVCVRLCPSISSIATHFHSYAASLDSCESRPGIDRVGVHAEQSLFTAVAVGELEFDDFMLPIREDGFPRRCVAVHAFRLRPRKTLLGGTHAPVARAEHRQQVFFPGPHAGCC